MRPRTARLAATVTATALVVLPACGGDEADRAAGQRCEPYLDPDECPEDQGAREAAGPPDRTDGPPVAPPDFGADPDPVVVGHRGAAGHHPDNSLEGFAAARELGATWVELDTRLSADGDVFLSHDPETALGLVVAEASSADLAAEGLPTLREALDVIDENALGVDVEIKSLPTEEGYDQSLEVVDATMAVLQARPPTGPVLVSSFNPLALERVREITGDDFDTVLVTSGVGEAEDLAATLVDAGHDGLAIGDPDLPAETVAVFADAGLPVWSWTVDEADVAIELVGRGVVGIITDVPDLISEALAD